MGVDRRLNFTYALTNLFFIAAGAVTIAVSLIWRTAAVNSPTTGPVERNIIFLMTPTMFGIGAGVITVIAGVLSLPALAVTTRGWLRVQAWAVFVASLVLLVVGLKVWTLTLDEKDNILAAYTQTSPNTIEALEERFNCCGFFNSTSPPFVVSPNACPDSATAATRNGCVIPLQPFADLYLDRLFTTLFGFVGIGTCAILANAMLLKARTTEARYVRIAEKGIF
jgi:hypothetical protein